MNILASITLQIIDRRNVFLKNSQGILA